MKRFTAEIIKPLNIGHNRGGYGTDGRDQKPRPGLPAILQGDVPDIAIIVKNSGNDTGIKLDIFVQIELVSDVFQIP